MNGRKTNPQSWLWLIVLQSVLYGIMDVVSKHAYETMPVYCFLFLRYVLASAIMLVLWGRTILTELRQAPVSRYLVPGICMAAAFIFSNLALRFTAATNMSFLRSLSALMVPLLTLVFFRQRLAGKEWVLMGLMLVGLYLLCAKGGLSGFGLGEVFALLSATLVAGSLVFGKHALDYVSARTLSFVQAALAVLFCGVAAWISGDLRYVTTAVSPKLLLALAYAAVCCTILGYMLQNMALRQATAKQIGMVQCLYPIATAVSAYLFLRERLTASGVVGAGIITLCVLLENRMKPDEKAPCKTG